MNEASDSIETILENIDWPLLSEQKHNLLSMCGNGLSKQEDDTVMGVVHLLDALQDHAAEIGLWEFPEKTV